LAAPWRALPACACAEQGLSCILLERTKTIKAINRGDVLTPLTIALCERWGVLEHLRALGGYEMYGFSFYSPRLGLLGRWDFRSLNFRFNYELTLSHPKIHQALYAAIANSPCVEVRRGATMRSLVWENDRVAAVTGEYEGKEFCARGCVVVAADGMDSKIRSELGIGVEERYQYAHEYMMFEIPKLKVEEMEHWGLQYVGRKGFDRLDPLGRRSDARASSDAGWNAIPVAKDAAVRTG
jgi:2-polyprenyl-6-methoxyphenol hydroxylase-like FAD-dependent oxidoreductase